MDDFVHVIEKVGPTIVAMAAMIVTFVTVNRQIRAATISASRQRWIDSLQDVVSRMFPLKLIFAFGGKLGDGTDTMKAMDEFAVLFARLKLMLNPDSQRHSELLTACQAYLESLSRDEKELRPAFEKVLAAARKVIDNEWSKIKHGK